MPSSMGLTITVIQVIQGGEPDECGLSFQFGDLPDPTHHSLLGSRCACERTALFDQLWDAIGHHDMFSRGTDIWLRTVSPDDAVPLPPGAHLLEERTVMFGVA